MLKNYLTVAWRNITKNVLHSAINIIGLGVALASFIVILIYFNYELSFDKWDPSLKRVYKVSLKEKGDVLKTTPEPLAELLHNSDPQITAATTIQPAGDFELLLDNGKKQIYQKGLVTVEDSSFLKVFPYKLVQGDPATALNAPNAVIISEGLKARLFDNADPIGKTIKIHNAATVLITGVMKAAGGPSHLDAQLVMRDPWGTNKTWSNYSFQTYIKLNQAMPETKLEGALNTIYFNARIKNAGKESSAKQGGTGDTELFTDRVEDLNNFPKHGESHFKVTLLLLILAVFLLVAGAINFSNLAVARAITRAKEVGIRKVMGSNRVHIIMQSLLEIGLQCLISLTLAIIFVNIALPYFGKNFNIPLSFLKNGNVVPITLQITGSIAAIILLAGLYPALFLSKFQAAAVLKGKFADGAKGIFLRNSLLLIQLTLSALFVTGIIVINRQLNFIQHKDLGLNPQQVIRITATQASTEQNFKMVKNMLLGVPGILSVSKSTSVPAGNYIDTSTSDFKYAGEKYRLNNVKISADYFKTLDIKLITGRYFEDGRPEDADNTAIINESALKKLGGGNIIGQAIRFPYCDSLPYTIVGVVKDFNIQGMESGIVPTVYSTSNAHCGFRSGNSILLKINTMHTQQTLRAVTSAWKKIEPAFPIRYSFLDQDFAKLFTTYTRLRQIVLFFSIISVLISATGLFALTSFLARLRTKEIGIRKVLGASVSKITALLSRDFIVLVMFSVAIALPASWWLGNKWLDGFAFKVNLTWWTFASAALVTVSITLLTVLVQSAKTALANPVKSLRSE